MLEAALYEGNEVSAEEFCKKWPEFFVMGVNKDNSFEDTFTILNMDSAFRQVKEDSGVQLHGILGSLFFQKYKYVIDFKSLVAYIRK